MLIALAIQAVPLPPQAPRMASAEDFTRPLLSLDCAVRSADGLSGRLIFETTGGRAFAAQAAPTVGGPAAAGFRRVPQALHVRADDLSLLAAPDETRIDMGSHGGSLRFRSRLFAGERSVWWNLATFVDTRAGTVSPARTHRLELIDASGRAGYVSGVCTIHATPQTPLAPQEIALESER